MISFFVCLAILIGGYFIYGKYVTNVFGPDDRETPAISMEDGVDYVVMPTWRIFLIQLLNIAGLGPIWGCSRRCNVGSQRFPVDYLRYRFRRCCPRLRFRLHVHAS